MAITFRCHNPDCKVLLRAPYDVTQPMQCPRCGHVHLAPADAAESAKRITTNPDTKSPKGRPRDTRVTERDDSNALRWLPNASEFVCPWCEEEVWLQEETCPTCGADLRRKALEKTARRRLRTRSCLGWASAAVGVMAAAGLWILVSASQSHPVRSLPWPHLLGTAVLAVAMGYACWESPSYPLLESQRIYSRKPRIRFAELVYDLL